MKMQSTYMGLKLNSPIVVSACTLSEHTDNILKMEDYGAGAVVLFSLFEEQIRKEEALFNGVMSDLTMSSSEVEHRYLNIIQTIKHTVKIPVAVKLNPYFSAMGNMSLRMKNAGADALVLFNRFYQPDFDIHELTIKTDLHYSESSEIRLPLLWIALLYGKVNLSLAATTGVQSAVEVIKYILAGADVVMTASSLYKNGITYLNTMNKELGEWMRIMGFDSIDAFKGSMSQQHISDPTAYERDNYIKILEGVK